MPSIVIPYERHCRLYPNPSLFAASNDEVCPEFRVAYEGRA